MNRILLLICIEGNYSNTERGIFISFTQKGVKNIYSEYFDCSRKTDKELDVKVQNKLIRLFSNQAFIKADEIECLIYCDGDLKFGHWEAIDNTYKLTKAFVENYFKKLNKIVNISEHLYDKNQKIEFFIWLLLPQTNKELVEKHISGVYKKMNDDLKDFFKIQDIKYIKKEEFRIWSYFKKFYKDNMNLNFIDEYELINYLLINKEELKSYSVYFKVLEKLYEYWNDNWK